MDRHRQTEPDTPRQRKKRDRVGGRDKDRDKRAEEDRLKQTDKARERQTDIKCDSEAHSAPMKRQRKQEGTQQLSLVRVSNAKARV